MSTCLVTASIAFWNPGEPGGSFFTASAMSGKNFTKAPGAKRQHLTPRTQAFDPPARLF